jgi:hypothetical protein
MMEAASTSKTSVNFYQITRRINPEDSHLHTRRLENLKPYIYGHKAISGELEMHQRQVTLSAHVVSSVLCTGSWE